MGEVSSHAVANAFLKIAAAKGKTLTNMQLQKLVFLAQGYCLAVLDRPIYFHDTHAWQWGPVVPKLYKSLQQYGSGNVTDSLLADDVVVEDSDEFGIIEGVWDSYGGYTGGQLSTLTHKPGSPWEKQWNTKQFGVIPLDEIKKYYADLTKT